MTHSVELLLDESSDAAIRSVWRALDEAGLPSAAAIRSSTNRPHVTLIAAGHINPEVDDALRNLTTEFPMPCVIGSPLVFGERKLTLTRMIVPSTQLLALHSDVYRRSVPHVPAEPFPHSDPGHWVPHITLGRRFTPAQIGQALAVLDASPDIAAQVTGLRRWDGDQRLEHLMVV